MIHIFLSHSTFNACTHHTICLHFWCVNVWDVMKLKFFYGSIVLLLLMWHETFHHKILNHDALSCIRKEYPSDHFLSKQYSIQKGAFSKLFVPLQNPQLDLCGKHQGIVTCYMICRCCLLSRWEPTSMNRRIYQKSINFRSGGANKDFEKYIGNEIWDLENSFVKELYSYERILWTSWKHIGRLE